MKDTVGYIYVLTNPSFPEYIKIGYADNVDDRVKQLNRTECTPFAFQKYATLAVATRLADKKIHQIFDQLKPELRAKEIVNGKLRVREFFAMSADDAVEILSALASLSGEEVQIFKPTTVNKKEQLLAEELMADNERRSPFSFYKCGIKNGEKIIFAHDTSIICTVIGEREILYGNEQTSLSALARKLLNRKSGVQGTLHFKYKGEVLSALRKRLEDEGKYSNTLEMEQDISQVRNIEDEHSGVLLNYVGKNFDAKCLWVNKQFTLLKGSKISQEIRPSARENVKKWREEYKNSISQNFIILDDINFGSSSSAAQFVAGISVNGKICWKAQDGTLLKDLLND